MTCPTSRITFENNLHGGGWYTYRTQTEFNYEQFAFLFPITKEKQMKKTEDCRRLLKKMQSKTTWNTQLNKLCNKLSKRSSSYNQSLMKLILTKDTKLTILNNSSIDFEELFKILKF